MDTAEISDMKEDISIEIPHHKPQKRVLLKSVVTGTTIFAAVLVLLHLRFVCFQGLAVPITEYVWIGSFYRFLYFNIPVCTAGVEAEEIKQEK